jgi:hypothetical protein
LFCAGLIDVSLKKSSTTGLGISYVTTSVIFPFVYVKPAIYFP